MKHITCIYVTLLLFLFLTMEEDSMKPMQKEVLYPTVRVECLGVGSGVVIASQDDTTLILTAKHVLAKKHKCRVTLYPEEITYPATVVAKSKDHDLALIQIQAETPFVARLPDNPKYEKTMSVWKAGCGAGHDPFVAKGHLGDINPDHILFTAPVVGGDSGGGVYTRRGKHYVLIGIITAHAMGPTGAVHHLGYAHNWDSIMEFLSQTA